MAAFVPSNMKEKTHLWTKRILQDISSENPDDLISLGLVRLRRRQIGDERSCYKRL